MHIDLVIVTGTDPPREEQLPEWDVGAALQAMDRLSIEAAILRSLRQATAAR